MASYFDLPTPEPAAGVANIEQVPAEGRKQLGRMSLMSPALTQLLDDLEDDDSDSSEGEESLLEDEDSAKADDQKHHSPGPSRQANKEQRSGQARNPSSLSPSRASTKASSKSGSGHVKLAPAHSGGSNSARQKPPTHMTRFHSLRSMLFQSNIEVKMKTATQEDCKREEAVANNWKTQHEERQIHRPKTPESDGAGKDGIGNRIRGRIRRMTSKEVPVMGNISEDEAVVQFDDRASSASSDNEIERYPLRGGDGDDQSINDADVNELVQWVSRRDPGREDVAEKGVGVRDLNQDSDTESLAHDDVDDLVRWVSRRSNTEEKQEKQTTGYSDASTESDTELIDNSSEDEVEDADELVRWISHRDGSRAGPVRRNLKRSDLDTDVEAHYDSDVPELGRWFKRHDDTSGESAVISPAEDREDFLGLEEMDRGRPRSRESASSLQK